MSQATLFASPRELGPLLRYYQEECQQAVLAGIASGERAQLVVMATGLGKSVVFAALVRDFPGNVLVLAHRDELIQQAQRHLEAATGEPVEVEQAELTSWRGRIVVGSVQSVCRKQRLERLGKDRFGLLVIDEFHHAVSPSYREIMNYFECPVAGFTATPDRGDEKALGAIVDRVAYSMDIQEGIEQGWLVPFDGRRVVLEEINLDIVGKTAGDLAAHELDAAMLRSVKGVARETLGLLGARQAIAFWPGVRSAELACMEFNSFRPDMACFISGQTDPDERKQIVKEFRSGRFQVLHNCQVATEGFDVPEVSAIIQARPTLSRNLYAQMIGRGGRPAPGIFDGAQGRDESQERRELIARSSKQNCLIIDCVGNSTRHSLIGPEDALGGNFDEATVKLAKEKLAKKGGDPLRALKEAQAEIKAILQRAKVSVRATVTKFDPFSLLGVSFTDEDRHAQRFGMKPATVAQRALLEGKGMSTGETADLSKRAASRLLDEMQQRWSKNLATYKQVRQLEKFGVSARNVSFERARGALDYIASTGWGRSGIDARKLYQLCHGERQPGED